jgi:ubiquinone biosynthesis protein
VRRRRLLRQTFRHPRRIRRALEELGPTFIKLGQIVSNRTDLLPGGLVQELTHLQDDVAPFSAAEARRIIEEDLQAPITDIFGQFSDAPEASASIAQVHRARLLTGTAVAVKVQRPDIEEIIETDLEIVSAIANLAERYIPRARLFSPVELVEEFRRTIQRELNLTIERENTDRFRDMYHDGTNLYVPKTYRALSSPRVITMEYIRGCGSPRWRRIRAGAGTRPASPAGPRISCSTTGSWAGCVRGSGNT